MLEVLLLLLVDDVLAGVEVDLVGLVAAALGVNHVAEEGDEVDGDTEVGGDEGGVVERLACVDEDSVVLGQGDEAAEEESDVRAPAKN